MYELGNFTLENGYIDVIVSVDESAPENYEEMLSAAGAIVEKKYHLINAVHAKLSVENTSKFAGLNFVDYIEPNYDFTLPVIDEGDEPILNPDSLYYWNMENINAPDAWDAGYTGKGVKVAVLDTGIDHWHNDLHDNMAYGYNFVHNNENYLDCHGHGTHCAGIIAANGKMRGVAPNADLYGIQVLDKRGRGTYDAIIAGVEWAVDNHMDVVSMSLGAPMGTPALEEACDRAKEEGVIIVAAAGNSGADVGYPAAYDSTITVGAVDDKSEVAWFSSRGPQMDVVAPGVLVRSTFKRQWYKNFSGTSMATPHVAGAVVLLREQNPNITFDEVREKLRETANLNGRDGFTNDYGYGMIDLKGLLDL